VKNTSYRGATTSPYFTSGKKRNTPKHFDWMSIDDHADWMSIDDHADWMTLHKRVWGVKARSSMKSGFMTIIQKIITLEKEIKNKVEEITSLKLQRFNMAESAHGLDELRVAARVNIGREGIIERGYNLSTAPMTTGGDVNSQISQLISYIVEEISGDLLITVYEEYGDEIFNLLEPKLERYVDWTSARTGGIRERVPW
jgi:hypothetical protein